MSLICGDIFAGGGGWGIGAEAAGHTLAWSVEQDPAIAEVHAANLGGRVIAEAAQSVDIRRLEPIDCLLASPPCQSHSNARAKSLPARDDAEVGLCVLDYVRVLRPRFVMVENVEGWKRSHSFKAIFHGLHELGYFCDVRVINAADMGVPQTRRRLFLRASREGFLPPLPPPTPWRGWYSAIEDLIPTLPESRFADWQLARLPKAITASIMVSNQNGAPAGVADRGPRCFDADEPTGPILSSQAQRWRAFIVRASDQRENCDIGRGSQEPVFTLTEGNTAHGRVKAFVVSNTKTEWGDGIRSDTEPVHCITGESNGRTRAFLMDSKNTGQEWGKKYREDREPAISIVADDRPSHRPRAWLEQGRVVAMNPRALARFQSFPDSYELPAKVGLACRVVGNAVPALLARKLLEGLGD